jgi:hypothetical protein
MQEQRLCSCSSAAQGESSQSGALSFSVLKKTCGLKIILTFCKMKIIPPFSLSHNCPFGFVILC